MIRYYLNALGIISPLGSGATETAKTLFAGSQEGLVAYSDPLRKLPTFVGRVAHNPPEVPEPWQMLDCRNNRLALAALQQIEFEVRSAIAEYGHDRIGVILGTSTSGIAEGEQALAIREQSGAWPSSFDYSQQEIGGLSECIACYLGISGPAYTLASACSSSGKTFASAARLLDSGTCDAVIVGGADTFCRLTLNGFSSLESISPNRCNPFSKNRDGINIGEGAALFLLSRKKGCISLLGTGEYSEAHHISAPDPTGAGAIATMQQALAAAALQARDIAYLNLHGTATPLNDAMEGKAVSTVFGKETPCSATKALTGHTLGAAGAIEAAILWLTLHPDNQSNALPPHIWDGETDNDIPPLDLVERRRTFKRTSFTAMQSNSFAFGGSNVSVILGYHD